MKIEINIEKKHFTFLILVLVIAVCINYAIAQSPPNPGHGAGEIGPGTFASSGTYIFPSGSKIGIGITSPSKALEVSGDIEASGDICTTGGECLSTAGPWIVSGDDMYSDVSGNVGINTSNPSVALEVEGNMKVTGNINASDPTEDSHVATKAYVDSSLAGGSGPVGSYGGSFTKCYAGACDIPNYFTGACNCTEGYTERYLGHAYYPTSGVCSDWQYFYECVK